MEKKVLTYELYDAYINKLACKIEQSGKKYTGVYGIPRGGYYPAIKLGKLLDLPVFTELSYSNILVVDDICDSGATLENYFKYDKAVVFCRPYSTDKCTYYGAESPEGEWIVFPDEKGETVEDNIRRIFEYIGEDPNRTGLLGTPDRIIRMWAEIFRGYDETKKPKITVFPNGEDGITYDSMVIDEGDYYSMCVPGFQCVNSVGKKNRARDQRVGDKLWTIVNGIPVQTTITEITTHKADGYVNITLANGKRFSVTADHPLRSEGEWIEAGSSLGRKVEWINPKTFTQKHYDFKVGKKLGYFLAVVAAECSVQEDRRICLETNNSEVTCKFYDALYNVFGYKANIETICKPNGFGGKMIQYRIRVVSSEIARRTLKMLNIPFGSIGCGSKTQKFHLPEIVKANYDCWRGFVEGYLDTDGTRYRGEKQEYDRIMSTNKDFINELRDFMGVASRNGVKGIRSAVSKHDVYNTNISKKVLSEEWFKKHGFEKYEANIDLGESEMVEVVSVEFVDKPTKVYSFKCDNEHTFCINGVLTHNCEHHMMPFFGHYWFAYIPNPKGKILGISKIGRVVDYCAAKLQVQERLTHDIVEMLEKALGEEYPPLGIALVMRGSHLCKEMRGVKKKGIMTSSFLTGAFKNDAETRAEFMNFVNKK